MTNILTLTEIIFTGVASKIDFQFLKELLSKSDRIRFNFPEEGNNNYSFIVNLLESSEYIDIAFDSLKLNSISNVFANLVLNNEKIELLFFLDLKDTYCETHKESVDMLIAWAKDYGSTHNFDTIKCQPDNAEEDEFYFKDGEYGSYYNRLT